MKDTWRGSEATLLSGQYFNGMLNILQWINEAVLYFQTMGEQLRPNLRTNWCCCYFVIVFKTTMAVAMGHYLTGCKNNHLHQAISGDIWGKKKCVVAAAVPRNKADILEWKQFDQLKPEPVLCHVQKSPQMHANMLNTPHKVIELCNFSPWFQNTQRRDGYRSLKRSDLRMRGIN